MPELQIVAVPKAGGLLRVLLLWLDDVPSSSGAARMLRLMGSISSRYRNVCRALVTGVGVIMQ